MAHYEIVRTDAGWHGRLIANNGKVIMSTEVYKRKRAAQGSVAVAFEAAGFRMNHPPTSDFPGRILGIATLSDEVSFPLPEVDER